MKNYSKKMVTNLACLPDYEPKLIRTFNLPAGQCFLVIDRTILGRCWGGFRVVDNLSLDEIKILARSMTFKNMLAGIPIGGAKGGMCVSTKNYNNSSLVDSISKVIGPFLKKGSYYMGTDIGFKEETVNSVYTKSGCKRSLYEGKMSVGEACAHGISTCLEYLKKTKPLDLDGGTVALEGFGRLGIPTAKLLSSKGFKIVAVSNINGAVYDPDGLDINELIRLSELDQEKMLSSYIRRHSNSILYPKEAINELDCDILIPGARIFTIDDSVARNVKAKIVCPLSNAPITSSGETMLAKREIISIPDFISNSGGGIASFAQHLGAKTIQTHISKIITRNLELVFSNLNDDNIPKITACAIGYELLKNLERHEKIGTAKLFLSWVRKVGPTSIWNGAMEYLTDKRR